MTDQLHSYCSKEFKEKVRKAANACALSESAYIRTAIIEKMKRDSENDKKITL